MEIDLRDKILAHPVWQEKWGRVSNEEWEKIRAVPARLKFMQGDEMPNGKVFHRYFKGASSGMLMVSKEALAKIRERCKAYAAARYVKKGRRTKTPEEKRATVLANIRRNSANKWARHRARMLSDAAYAEHWRAMEKIRYEKNKKAIIARMMAKSKTPYMIAKNRLSRSIKRHLANLLAGTSHKHSEGAQFLVWLAQKQGVDITQKHEWHIDHLRPIKSFDLFADGVRANVNGPENVRWLTAKENLLKGAHMPTEEEVAAHALLVAEWRATL